MIIEQEKPMNIKKSKIEVTANIKDKEKDKEIIKTKITKEE